MTLLWLWLSFAFTKPVIFIRVKCVTKSNRQFFKLESDSRDLSLFLIIFMKENDCSHLYVVLKRQAYLWENFVISGKCSHGNDQQKTNHFRLWKSFPKSFPGLSFGLSNFIFNTHTEFALGSVSSICILLSILRMLCSLSENGFINSSMGPSSEKSLKRLSFWSKGLLK